jgi:UDP-2,3-diacylglucosamine pyrophosphatase LpxH
MNWSALRKGVAILAISLASEAGQTEPSDRAVVLLSDTHFGVGKDVSGIWDPTEDFRWPHALHGFLNYVSAQFPGPVDLVVVGDFLELWQPPAYIPCKGHGPNFGCTIDEMKALATLVVDQHRQELADLREFSKNGQNKLYVVPGNHDSALLESDVWSPLEQALDAQSGHVTFVNNGVWVSSDGTIMAEHGHQIGGDVNRFAEWPTISKTVEGKDYMIRPWGEQFVQQLFNETEREYPIIDNISPESVGAKYRIANRGIPETVADLGRFIAFNLFETSLRQKGQVLGEQDGSAPKWDVAYARSQGYRLFLDGLEADDPLRSLIDQQSPQGMALREQLDKLAQNLTAEDMAKLCADLYLKHAPTKCIRGTQGATFQAILNTKAEVIRKHLLVRLKNYDRVRFFVYGHTHQYETPWEIKLPGPKRVTVANTGAFQRIIDEEGFKKILRDRKLSAEEALKRVTLEELPSCYTYVAIVAGKIRTLAWTQSELGDGHAVDLSNEGCH